MALRTSVVRRAVSAVRALITRSREVGCVIDLGEVLYSERDFGVSANANGLGSQATSTPAKTRPSWSETVMVFTPMCSSGRLSTSLQEKIWGTK